MSFFRLLSLSFIFLSSHLTAITPVEETQRKEYCINHVDAIKLSKYSLKKFKHLKILREDKLNIDARINYPSLGINRNGDLSVGARGFGNSNLHTRDDIKVVIIPKSKNVMLVELVSRTAIRYQREFSVKKFFSHYRDFYEKWPSKTNCK